MIPTGINISEFIYDLPEERIAQHPAKTRDEAKLLIYNGDIRSDVFGNIDSYLPAGSLLVFNNTRVIRARILFRKETGAGIEVFCLEPLIPSEYELSFSSGGPVEWKCIIGNLKKWKNDIISCAFKISGRKYQLSAEKIKPEGEAMRIRFTWTPDDISFAEVTEAIGHIPLPPYIKRDDEPEDNLKYQTVYSKVKGSVAAPTAGLHFTDQVLDKLTKKGIKSEYITLHVGAGTFKPVKVNDISRHEMHSEHFFINSGQLEVLLKSRNKVIAVGTTSVRTVESLYWLGVKLILNPGKQGSELYIGQWEPYQEIQDISFKDSLQHLAGYMKKRKMTLLHGVTSIMIVPGYKFRMISGMITNFHQPGSTLLLLVAAWTGVDWKKIYSYALDNKYRFLSYGDSSLLLKQV